MNTKVKCMAVAWLAVLLATNPGFAENVWVKEMRGKEIVIEDRDTGKTWLVREGEVMENGWKVTAVTNEFVIIEKEVSERKRLRAQLPANGLQSRRPESPSRTP